MDNTHYGYVFQRRVPDSLLQLPVLIEACEPVAHVLHTGSAEEAVSVAFKATNSADPPWHETLGHFPNPVGTAYRPARSTSTGDLVVVGNRVWRLGEPNQHCEQVDALDLIYLIPNPGHMLHAAMLTLADRYQHKLSLGYIGNVWSDGPVAERDDREWSVFGPRNCRWGRFSTKELPLMATRAKTKTGELSVLEHWVKALAEGNTKAVQRLAYGFAPS